MHPDMILSVLGILVALAVFLWLASIIVPLLGILGSILIVVGKALFYIIAIPVVIVMDFFNKRGENKRKAFEMDAKTEFKKLLKEEKEKRQAIKREWTKKKNEPSEKKEDGIDFNPFQ